MCLHSLLVLICCDLCMGWERWWIMSQFSVLLKKRRFSISLMMDLCTWSHVNCFFLYGLLSIKEPSISVREGMSVSLPARYSKTILIAYIRLCHKALWPAPRSLSNPFGLDRVLLSINALFFFQYALWKFQQTMQNCIPWKPLKVRFCQPQTCQR